MNDFVVPEGGFKSFNDFFIRRLKPGARVIDLDPSVFISPADSKLIVVPEIKPDTRFFVKSKKFCLKTFLRSERLAKEYESGVLCLFRLEPRDYHRYHLPCDAVVGEAIRINGCLESVNPIVYESGLLPLQENERHRIILQTKSFNKVIMVSIGAMFVGKITHLYSANEEYKKGDEVGHFSFGGSSLVLLFKRGVVNVDDRFLKDSMQSVETVVKMGERVGSLL